jgi:Zn-dependent protease with chaperone function
VTPGEAPRLAAVYFDGRTSARYDVTLTLDGPGLLRVAGSGVERIEPMSAIVVSEPLGGGPRLFTFADGAHCEVPLQPGLEAFLAAAGHADSVVVEAQSRWTWAIASAVVLVVALVAGYQYGLPWAAREIAERIPPPLVAALSEQTLDFLERAVLDPSQLPADRREGLTEKFRAMKPPNGNPVPHAVLFRAAPRIGANALALPSGTIVVTDELVQLTEDDGEILGVLAHELGHVQERHGLRLMVESSIVGFALAWYIGDVSSVAAGVPAALLQARYSREHERSADTYAARMLEANGMSPALLATMLEKLQASHGGEADRADEDEALDYLSSHPATRERIEALRER